MNIVALPPENTWPALCKRPERGNEKMATVQEILKNVRSERDKALFYYSGLFDGFSSSSLRISPDEINAARENVPGKLKKAIDRAKANIEKFHSAQITPEPVIETSPGVRCWRKNTPVEKAGLYIPGGSAPLFSTLLMLGIPAKLAGCKRIIICTPPAKDGKVDPIILYTASLLGLNEIYRIGGAQAVAAMAYGTESIPAVDKIFGPGNSYVTLAKELVQLDGVAIDMPAGPSEVLIIADENANPSYVAADLLSQAEHGPDSQVILVTVSAKLIEDVKSGIAIQTALLPRQETVTRALENSRLIQLRSIEECMDFSNMYAPEHLIINTEDPYSLAGMVINAGSVFLGRYSCESMGDYASGTNHTLPTYGYARKYSGVSVASFQKSITFQEVTAEGIKDLGPAVATMAAAEQLEGHMNAVNIRLTDLAND